MDCRVGVPRSAPRRKLAEEIAITVIDSRPGWSTRRRSAAHGEQVCGAEGRQWDLPGRQGAQYQHNVLACRPSTRLRLGYGVTPTMRALAFAADRAPTPCRPVRGASSRTAIFTVFLIGGGYEQEHAPRDPGRRRATRAKQHAERAAGRSNLITAIHARAAVDASRAERFGPHLLLLRRLPLQLRVDARAQLGHRLIVRRERRRALEVDARGVEVVLRLERGRAAVEGLDVVGV